MRNIALKLRYDGSAYHGWQIQKEDITVASVLEEALEAKSIYSGIGQSPT